MQIKELNFGDYSGLREYKRHPNYFLESFISPPSFSLNSLGNRGNFIIVGRKGAGKSSCCAVLAHNMIAKGYLSTFYNFSDDLSRLDLKEAVQTQTIDLKDISTKKLFDSIVEFYDFRDLWKRKVLHNIALKTEKASSFRDFMLSVELAESSISEGVGKGLKVELPDHFQSVLDHFKAKRSANSISLREYVRIGQTLLKENHPNEKHYYFFDELNLSHAKSDSSEYDTLIALIRDIVRASADLNDFFAENEMDIHVICGMRPEVRNEIIRRDNELSKTIDSNFVNLAWPSKESENNPMMDLLKSKIAKSSSGTEPLPNLLPKTVFNVPEQKEVEFHAFFLNLTWYRPRDVIRVLKCYQATNGEQNSLFSKGDDQLRFLKEYSRVSYQDCLAEMEVKYDRATLDAAMKRLYKPVFENSDELLGTFQVMEKRIDTEEFIKDLFEAGVIFNHDRVGGRTMVVAAYRDDTALDENLRVIVHRGLQAALRMYED